ncbi:MAG: hypothetical protein JSR77_02165 [Planctomycetes bacterium]|nr:hypothetical protein [Planctomycetota bacterium]
MKIVHASDFDTRHRPTHHAFSGLHAPLLRRVIASAVAGLAATAVGQSIVVDQFTQPVGEYLSSWGGGRGFESAWYTYGNSLSVAAQGLTYRDEMNGVDLATFAGKAVNTLGPAGANSNNRTIPIGSFPSGAEMWGSFLIETPSDGTGAASVGLRSPSNPFSLRFGVSGGLFAISTVSDIAWAYDVYPGGTTLVLFRIESANGGGGQVSMWLNPPLTGGLPFPSAVLPYWNLEAVGPNEIELYAIGSQCGLDELRLGVSPAAVLPRTTLQWPCEQGGNGHRYEMVYSAQPISRADAAAGALARGGILATVSDAAENALVFENLVAREDIWDRAYGDLSFVDTRGPWIGAQRPIYFPDPVIGWEWIDGTPWSYASWAPEGLVGIGELFASYYLATDAASPTWRYADADGYGRVHGYIVEYADTITRQPPDVRVQPRGTAEFSVAMAGGALSYQWMREGVPLADGPTSFYSEIQGATTPTLVLTDAAIEDLGAYSVQVTTACGVFESRAARLSLETTLGPVVDPDTCKVYQIIDTDAQFTWWDAFNDAIARGGELVSITTPRTQVMVDALAGDPSYWRTNSLGQSVGPWIGGSYIGGGEWLWRNFYTISAAGFENWAPGQPDNADGFEQYMHLTRSTGTYSTAWADLASGNPVGGTFPRSHIIEWNSAIAPDPYPATVDCGGTLTLSGRVIAAGLDVIAIWQGPTGIIVDGVSANGSEFSGQGTLSLTINGMTAADAGTYYLSTYTQGYWCGWGATYTVSVGECGAACPADFNQDGGIDGSDVDAYFAAWEIGDASADVNLDGGVDGSDIGTFFAAWEAGGC